MKDVSSQVLTWQSWISASYALADIRSAERVLISELGAQEGLTQAVDMIADELERERDELEHAVPCN